MHNSWMGSTLSQKTMETVSCENAGQNKLLGQEWQTQSNTLSRSFIERLTLTN